MTWQDAYNRGKSDAAKGRGSLFRKVGNSLEAEGDDPMADNWSQEDRSAYMAGFDMEEFGP